MNQCMVTVKQLKYIYIYTLLQWQSHDSMHVRCHLNIFCEFVPTTMFAILIRILLHGQKESFSRVFGTAGFTE